MSKQPLAKPVVTAADVIADAVDTATNCFLSRKHLRDATDDVVAALREACGGGDIVIRTDGTLATTDPVLCLHTENDTLRADDGTYVYEGPGTLYELVPVASLERGA